MLIVAPLQFAMLVTNYKYPLFEPRRSLQLLEVFLMGDVLPRETENTVYRYLIAISKLRLGILTEQGEGSYELVPILAF